MAGNFQISRFALVYRISSHQIIENFLQVSTGGRCLGDFAKNGDCPMFAQLDLNKSIEKATESGMQLKGNYDVLSTDYPISLPISHPTYILSTPILDNFLSFFSFLFLLLPCV